MHKNKKKKITAKSTNNQLVKGLSLSFAAGTAAFLILSSLMTLIAFKQDLQESLYPFLMIICFAVSGFISGLASGLIIRKNGLIMGLISVMPVYFLIISAACITSRSGINLWGWAVLGAMLISGAAGGIVAVNRQNRIKIK